MKKEMKVNMFDTPWESEYWMDSNGMSCGFNMPPALDEKEQKQGLPPYRWRKSFLVDEYPACPPEWMRSEGRITSFFVPVKEGHGMWLDFNKSVNDKTTHEIAIVISVQGVNPITGMPCEDAHLEQYIDECPKHKEKFGPNRFCKSCGYNWPKQNYISTTGTPNGMLWLDGFRTAEGIVRQYIMTAEKMRGVASNIIGKDRVYAVGISFFLSKEKKKEIPFGGNVRGFYSVPSASAGWQNRVCDYFDESNVNYLCSPDSDNLDINSNGGGGTTTSAYNASNYVNTGGHKGGRTKGSSAPQFFSPVHVPVNWKMPKDSRSTTRVGSRKGAIPESVATPEEIANIQEQLQKTSNDPNLVMKTSFEWPIDQVKTQKVEIGAGASIDQQVYDDPETLDFWRNEPESIIIINYCTEEDCTKIVSCGRVKLTAHPEGFLQSVPVGNKKETVNA